MFTILDLVKEIIFLVHTVFINIIDKRNIKVKVIKSLIDKNKSPLFTSSKIFYSFFCLPNIGQ